MAPKTNVQELWADGEGWTHEPHRTLALPPAGLALASFVTFAFVATVDIALLWCAIAATVVASWRVRPAAGTILLPYLAWVTFATALNASIWSLNR